MKEGSFILVEEYLWEVVTLDTKLGLATLQSRIPSITHPFYIPLACLERFVTQGLILERQKVEELCS